MSVGQLVDGRVCSAGSMLHTFYAVHHTEGILAAMSCSVSHPIALLLAGCGC
jgi:hypothetical protein